MDKNKASRIGRTLLKVIIGAVGIVAVLMVTVQVALSPALLTRIVNGIADDYIDGDLDFGKVSVSVVKSFPNLNVTLDSVVLTYPAERFAEYETGSAKARLLKMGKAETGDTLAAFRRFSASIDIGALITGNIHIPDIELTGPRIFAKSYNDSTANWQILKSETTAAPSTDDADGTESSGTTVSSLPGITLERISLDGRPFIVLCSAKDTLFAALNIKEMKFRGRLSTRQPQRNRIGFTVDSMFIGGRLSGDTLAFALQRFRLREHRGDFALNVKAGAALATRSFGRIFIPVDIESRVNFIRDSLPGISISRLRADIAGLPVDIKGDARFTPDSIRIKADASIDQCKVNDILRFWGRQLIPAAAKLRTDATISLNASINGWYNVDGSRLPAIDVRLDIPESPVSHSGIRLDSRIAADIRAKGGGDAPVDLDINDFHLDGKALKLALKGSARDLLGNDPLFEIDGGLDISLDTLGQFIRKSTGLSVSGELASNARGKIRMSQISPYTFADADLTGFIRSGRLNINSEKDSIDVHIDSLDIVVATTGNRFDRSIEEGTRVIAVAARLDSTSIRYKDALSASGSALSIAAQNDAAVLDASDSSSYYPFSGKVSIGRLSLTDRDSTRITIRDSDNTFKVSPSKADREIPVLSLKSDSRAIRLRSAFDRASVRELGINIVATKSDARRKRMAKAFVDSLARRFPDVPRDSLFSHLRKIRGATALPDWLTEEDFRKNDLNFKLGDSMSKYFREWDFYGGLEFRRASIMTPAFPLRTSLNDFDGYITNNELTLNGFTLRSGRSEITADGKLTGLRGALLNNRPVKLDLGITSSRLNLNELLGAYSRGQSFNAASDSLSVAAETMDDETYEEIVAADSLSSDSVLQTSLIVIPANLIADISLKASNVTFSKMEMSSLSAELNVKERCAQLTDIKAVTNVGDLAFDGFYSTRTKSDITAGFSLNLNDITAEKIIEMMPAVDSIMPMLKSFYGQLDCELAATAQIDTAMNIMMPSLNGVLRIKGKDLALVESEDLYKIAKILKFKDIHNIKIDDMSVEGLIGDSRVEIFPFVLNVDRYSLALSGIQSLDQSFRYHISILRSPLLIRFGVDLWGPDFDNMKFKIGRAKYKDANIPVFSSVIDETRLNLLESIRNIFSKGVDAAVRENERQEAVTEYKEDIGYRNAAETDIEELSSEESAELESADDSQPSSHPEHSEGSDTDNPSSHPEHSEGSGTDNSSGHPEHSEGSDTTVKN